MFGAFPGGDFSRGMEEPAVAAAAPQVSIPGSPAGSVLGTGLLGLPGTGSLGNHHSWGVTSSSRTWIVPCQEG